MSRCETSDPLNIKFLKLGNNYEIINIVEAERDVVVVSVMLNEQKTKTREKRDDFGMNAWRAATLAICFVVEQ